MNEIFVPFHVSNQEVNNNNDGNGGTEWKRKKKMLGRGGWRVGGGLARRLTDWGVVTDCRFVKWQTRESNKTPKERDDSQRDVVVITIQQEQDTDVLAPPGSNAASTTVQFGGRQCRVV